MYSIRPNARTDFDPNANRDYAFVPFADRQSRAANRNADFIQLDRGSRRHDRADAYPGWDDADVFLRQTPRPSPTVVQSTVTRPPAPGVTSTTSAGKVPSFTHAYVLVLENEESSAIVGSDTAPYINSLIAEYGLATNYHAVAPPSEPNYLALFSGSTQGVTDDAVYNLSGTNLVDQLEAHGKTWRLSAQNVPPNCFSGATASGGADGPGNYARKHEPAISFTDISGNAPRWAVPLCWPSVSWLG